MVANLPDVVNVFHEISDRRLRTAKQNPFLKVTTAHPSTDASFNVGMAFAAVQTLAAGVYIVMNGQVFEAGRVRKDQATNKFVRC